MAGTCARCDRPSRVRSMCPTHYEQIRSRLKAYGRWESKHVDSGPVRAHIMALRAAGVGNKRLSKLTGVSHSTIQVIVTGRPERGSGPSKKVLSATAEKILAVEVPGVPHALVAPGVKVPAVGTRRRLQALVAAGYSRSELCRRLGMEPTNGYRLLLDEHSHVLATTARAVAKMFDELQMTLGSSVRARNDGRRQGWPLPLDWDEDSIDDPAAVAERSEFVRSVRAEMEEDIAERRELVEQWTRYGLSGREIAARLGITERTVERDRVALREQVAS